MTRIYPRLLTLLIFAASLYADSSPLNLRWADLPPALTGKSVTVEMKDGSSVKAKVTSVEPTALAVAATKQGQMSIPRENIAGVSFIGMHKRGRIIGTTLGIAGGLFVGSLVALGASGAAGAALMVGFPVAGYFIGRNSDRELVRITILPD